MNYYTLIKMNFTQYYNQETFTLIIPHSYNDILCNVSNDTKILIFEDLNDRYYSQFNSEIGHRKCEDNKCICHLGDFRIESINASNNKCESLCNLPNTITHIKFGTKFNQKVDFLPNSIVELIFGKYFNQKVDMLPNSLVNLIFGLDFNNKVDYLPKNLVKLTFNRNFNQSVNKLPNSITHLTFGRFLINP